LQTSNKNNTAGTMHEKRVRNTKPTHKTGPQRHACEPDLSAD